MKKIRETIIFIFDTGFTKPRPSHEKIIGIRREWSSFFGGGMFVETEGVKSQGMGRRI